MNVLQEEKTKSKNTRSRLEESKRKIPDQRLEEIKDWRKAKEKILDQRSEESKGRENSRSRSKESKKTYKKVIGLDNV